MVSVSSNELEQRGRTRGGKERRAGEGVMAIRGQNERVKGKGTLRLSAHQAPVFASYGYRQAKMGKEKIQR